MGTKHTPTPWYANLQKDGWFDIQDSPDANTANVLCTRFAWAERKDEMHANAEFIVRACNSYEQMVAALAEANDLLALNGIDLDDDTDYGNGRADNIVGRIRAALAAAGAA